MDKWPTWRNNTKKKFSEKLMGRDTLFGSGAGGRIYYIKHKNKL